MDEFSFPYPPYPIQLDLMRELDTCLENKKTGIFESPTGTGKWERRMHERIMNIEGSLFLYFVRLLVG